MPSWETILFAILSLSVAALSGVLIIFVITLREDLQARRTPKDNPYQIEFINEDEDGWKTLNATPLEQ